MPVLISNCIRTRYEIEGDGPPLLLIAVNGMDRTCFRDQVPEFSRWFRCITYDMRGIGESDVRPADYGVMDMARDELSLLDGLGMVRAQVAVYWLGGCMGRRVAVEALERRGVRNLYLRREVLTAVTT